MRRNVHADHISQRCWGRTNAKNCGTTPIPFTGHPKALRPLLLGDTFSLLRIRGKFEAIFIALLFPWTSFCFPEFLTLNFFVSGVSDLYPSIPYLCSQIPYLFPWVPYLFPRVLYWIVGALRVPCSLPWIHDVFPCMLYLDYYAHFAVYFLTFLLFPALLISFLHRLFIFRNSLLWGPTFVTP